SKECGVYRNAQCFEQLSCGDRYLKRIEENWDSPQAVNIRKLAALGAEMGWQNVPLYGVHLTLSRYIYGAHLFKYYLVAQPVSEKPNLPPHRGRSIHIRLVPEKDRVVREFPRP